MCRDETDYNLIFILKRLKYYKYIFNKDEEFSSQFDCTQLSRIAEIQSSNFIRQRTA